MPTIFSHAVAALALGTAFSRPRVTPVRFWTLGAVLSAAPDLDVISFRSAIPYGHLLGHRGLSHSLIVAALVGGAVTWAAFPRPGKERADGRPWIYLILATASHGLLDACTDGGGGVALLAPLTAERFFLPWQPIRVSPIGLRFFSPRGLAVLVSELRWIWLPSLLFAAGALLIRRRLARY